MLPRLLASGAPNTETSGDMADNFVDFHLFLEVNDDFEIVPEDDLSGSDSELMCFKKTTFFVIILIVCVLVCKLTS